MEPREIKKLDEVVINRIAAGEVIQRPANALKEMIENSLDAKSTNIQVTVKNGGLKLLQIQDNGCGIRKADFEIVCERFTTSKLREFEDLSTISTYGFRGEALASISHVAHLTIISKTATEKCAYKASYEDGKLKEGIRPIAGNQGTQISVEDLFYNMTVRRNALRSPAEEYQKISDVVGKYAIHNSQTGFSLKKHGENNDIRTAPRSSAVDNIRTIYGNLIARELIEFAFENKPFKFKVNGQISNVNYSTKKLQFILFINHRLVECQGLKRAIDQIYTTYLPKNSHPFIYLSLEIDPRNIDVNVHPTKHEVHFLDEDQIIEAISTALETKLLGCNNSRIFYTQARLPGAPQPLNETKLNVTVYDKDLVRTDSSVQKLEKFFGPARKVAGDESFSEQFGEINQEFLMKNESFEGKLLESPQRKFSEKKLSSIVSGFEKKSEKPIVKLKSVLDMQTVIEESCDDSLREIFADHVFVGAINPKQSLIQHGTRLYLCDTEKILQELFYEFLVFHFDTFGAYRFAKPLSIRELAKIALDLPETGWSPEDGDKQQLAERIVEILTEKGEMLNEYYSMEIDENGFLKSIPIILDKFVPDLSGLPMYVLRLATEVDWERERECFEGFSRETANFFAKVDGGKDWEYVMEHVLYPAVKDFFCPSKVFKENGAILQVADLPNLYKVFERC